MSPQSEIAVAVRRTLFMSAVAATGATTLPMAAQAQEAAADTEADAPEQTITVTGSRIRRVDEETAAPVFVLDSTQIQSSGVATLGDLIQRVPAISGAATNPQVNNGGGTGETNVELRGLGAQRTLVLLNGRRVNILGSNGTTSAVDINLIPINLIERVEVLKEGAGAIYGSDAIAGVVNFITRKDVDGAEASVEFGKTGESDGERRSASLLWGNTSEEKLNVLVGANYNKQEAVSAGARDFSRFALYLYNGLVTQGGSSRSANGRVRVDPGLGCDSGSVTRIDGASGTSIDDYRCFEIPGDLYNYQPFNLLMTPQERSNLFTMLNYKINDNVTSFAEVVYNHTSSGFALASLPFDATADDVIVSADNLYNPFGVDFGGIDGANPNFQVRLEGLGNRRSSVATDQIFANVGLRGSLFDSKWNWEASAGIGHMDQDTRIDGYLLSSLVGAAVGPSGLDAAGNPVCGQPGAGGVVAPADIIPACVPLNIFNPNDPAALAALSQISTNYQQNYNYRSENLALNLNGSLFEMPAGPLQTAFGVEYQNQVGEFETDVLTRGLPPLFLTCQLAGETCTGDSRAEYNSRDIYAEFFVPLLKDRPGVQALNLIAGIRYSDYSRETIGSSTNSTFKLEYRPMQDLLIRGSFTEVFRAPTILDLSKAPTQDAPTYHDPCEGITQADINANPNLSLACVGVPLDGTFAQPNGQVTGLITGSPNLAPETGDVVTYGLVYDPSFARGLSLTVDFWKYKLDDLITAVDVSTSSDQCVATGNPQFCGYMIRYPDGPNAGLFQAFLEPILNLGRLETDGVDIGVKYSLRNTAAGSFNFSLDLTHINSYDNVPAPGAATTEVAGTYDRQFGNYAKWRGLLGIGWKMGAFDSLVSVRYIDKIEVRDPDAVIDFAPPLPISSFTYADITFGYNFFDDKSRVQLGVMNVADKQPPILFQNNVLNANTDVSTYDGIGRRWFVGFTQKF